MPRFYTYICIYTIDLLFKFYLPFLSILFTVVARKKKIGRTEVIKRAKDPKGTMIRIKTMPDNGASIIFTKPICN